LAASYGEDLPGLARELVEEANRRGGPDNITVVLAHVEESPLVEPTAPVKLELPDSDEQFWVREKALRRLFKMPTQKQKRLPWLMACGGVCVLVAALLALFLVGRGSRPAGREVPLAIRIAPGTAARTARVWLDERELERPWQVAAVRTDSSYQLRVVSNGYKTVERTVWPDTTGQVELTMEGGAAVTLEYVNAPDLREARFLAVNEHDTVFDGLVQLPLKEQVRAGAYRFRVEHGARVVLDTTGVAVGDGQQVFLMPDGVQRVFVE